MPCQTWPQADLSLSLSVSLSSRARGLGVVHTLGPLPACTTCYILYLSSYSSSRRHYLVMYIHCLPSPRSRRSTHTTLVGGGIQASIEDMNNGT